MKIVYFLLIILFTSCSFQRYCNRCFLKCPTSDTTIFEESVYDTIIKKDTIIYDTIYGTRIIAKDSAIELMPGAKKSVELSNDYCNSKAYIDRGELFLELELKHQVIERRIKEAQKTETIIKWKDRQVIKFKDRIIKEPVYIKRIPSIIKSLLWITGIISISFILYIIYIIKKKLIK